MKSPADITSSLTRMIMWAGLMATVCTLGYLAPGFESFRGVTGSLGCNCAVFGSGVGVWAIARTLRREIFLATQLPLVVLVFWIWRIHSMMTLID
ncbi:MAG: hypothetical protein U1F77_19025 [Kiritimatiellia bacterium]